jgi:hypothetical protein
MLTRMEREIMLNKARGLHKAGKFHYKWSDSKEENEANAFAQLMADRELYRGTAIGRIIQKVMDFVDGLYQMAREIVTGRESTSARKIARGVESGKMYDREAGGSRQAGEAALAFEVAPGTKTKEFKDWFGDSKVVDENGKPVLVYHGTGANFSIFSEDKKAGGQLGKAFYFSPSPNAASMFANIRGKKDPESSPQVMPVYLSLQNPYIFESRSEIPLYGINTQLLMDQGYDGIIVKENGKLDELAAFTPTQIKSVFNRGAWSKDNPDIRYSQTAPPWYSALEQGIEGARQEKAPGIQWASMIDNMPGVKPEEIAWTGLKPWLLERKGKVSKQEILDYVRGSNVQVQEVVKKAKKGGTKYDAYQ